MQTVTFRQGLVIEAELTPEAKALRTQLHAERDARAAAAKQQAQNARVDEALAEMRRIRETTLRSKCRDGRNIRDRRLAAHYRQTLTVCRFYALEVHVGPLWTAGAAFVRFLPLGLGHLRMAGPALMALAGHIVGLFDPSNALSRELHLHMEQGTLAHSQSSKLEKESWRQRQQTCTEIRFRCRL